MLDRLHKDGPAWVYPIRQIVSHVVLVAVGYETDGGTNVIALIVEQGRRLDDVDVVVRPGHSKISMPYPQPVVSYSFKDQRGMLGIESGGTAPSSGRGYTLPASKPSIPR